MALEPAAVPLGLAHYDVPTLVILGDNIEGDARWPAMKERIERFAQQHACVEVVSLPSMGIRGNSHMIMMDRNNLQVADLAHDWLSRTLRD